MRAMTLRIVLSFIAATAATGLFAATPLWACHQATGWSVSGPSGNKPQWADTLDLATRCEQAVEDAQPRVPHRAHIDFELDVAFGSDGNHPLGRVLGVAWDGVRLHVLDGMQGVEVYDSLGHRFGDYGGTGEGPGEIRDQSGLHGSRLGYNQIASLPAGEVIVYGRDRLHLFDRNGAYIHRTSMGAELDGPFAVRHVASLDGSRAVVARSGVMASFRSDSTMRTGRQLLEVVEATPDGFAVQPLAYAYDRYSGNRPMGRRLPARGPYDAWTKRLWDAQGGILGILPMAVPGVCFFEADDLALASAFRLDARPTPVDRGERRRVISELRERSPSVPMTGESWESFYGFWPTHLPINLDIVIGPGAVTWIERTTSASERVVDLYHPAEGYLGTAEMGFGGVPLGFDDRCGYVVATEPEGERAEPFYGLERWCPSS